MRRALLGLAVLILSLTPAAVAAQDAPLELRLLPEYTPCVVNNVRFACFTAPQVAMLNALEALAQGTQRQLRISEDLRLQLDQLVINLQAQLVDHETIDTANQARIAELTAQLEHEIEQKNQYRAQAESVDYWPYVIGGAIGILGVGFGVGALLAQ
jgi:hypothetical protein